MLLLRLGLLNTGQILSIHMMDVLQRLVITPTVSLIKIAAVKAAVLEFESNLGGHSTISAAAILTSSMK